MNALEPSPEHLNFGEVWEDTHFSMVLPITNHRDHDIEIRRFYKTCNCSQIEPPSLTIPARQTREVLVTLDLTPRKAEEFGVSMRDFEVGIAPEVPGERQGKEWTIRGRVRSAIQSDPPLIDFGNVSELSPTMSIQRVRLTTLDSVANLTAACSSANFDVKVEKSSTGKANEFDLVIALKEVAKRGEIRCTISIVPQLTDNRRLPPRRVEVFGRIVSDIEASPPTIIFGTLPVGGSKSETVTLQSLTGRTFTVMGMRCEGVGLSVERATTSEGVGLDFVVKQKGEQRGEQNSRVFFKVVHSGGREEDFVVVVSYCGIEAKEN
ncbi:MAG: hypothetical protein ACYC3I_26230 [Gemmataceae bacterium]